MNKPIIEINGLSKKYRYGPSQPYYTLRDSLSNIFKPAPKNNNDSFWALKDVSMTVHEGEVVGIIGPNGSGKSTLLKILSRITMPTRGEAIIRGRVGSLLEVGTGFHQELTGRENLYLNGSILGMNRKEINNKFDEIVDFSGIEKFLDTPVKRYSSGMLVRLGFAVAAHLDPEILLIDEVLAVGDIEFQNKCLKKMDEVAKGGRTILFVSHNMNSIEQLCTSAVCLVGGKVGAEGKDVNRVVANYLKVTTKGLKGKWVNKNKKFDSKYFFPKSVSLIDMNDNVISSSTRNDADIRIVFKGHIKTPSKSVIVGYNIYQARSNILLYSSFSTDGKPETWPIFKKGECTLEAKIPRRFLNEDEYRIEPMIVYRRSLADKLFILKPGEIGVSLSLSIKGGLSDSPFWVQNRGGLIAPELKWELKDTV